MEKLTQSILAQLQNELATLPVGDVREVEAIGQAIRLCRQTIADVHRELERTQFESEATEIYYFKNCYPTLYAEYSFYVQWYRVACLRPIGDAAIQATYYQDELGKTREIFEQFTYLYQYQRSGASHLDAMYFVRRVPNTEDLAEEQAVFVKADHCPVTSYQLGRLRANERLSVQLQQTMQQSQGSSLPHISDDSQQQLQWTASKVALIELIYGLQGAGVFNHAATDIKQLTLYFEKVFNLHLGNVYNVFQEMRIRKKNRSAFLDLLRDRLLQRMDEMDVR